MPSGSFTLDDVRATYKPRDAWWTVFLVDPYTSHLVRFTANRTRITPNQLSVSALVLGFVAAGLFWTADTWALIAGALVFHLAFVLDCMDGKIARLKGTGSVLGGWLDYIFDRIRVFVCALALFGGQYHETERPYWLVRRNLPAPLVVVHLFVWAVLTGVRTRFGSGYAVWLRGLREGLRTDPGPRRPMRWRTVWRMTALRRPPIF